jgi:radical SAM superfamily enzyme YgiQ (UPF0313 family)
VKIALVVPRTGAEGQKSFYDYAFYSEFLLSKKYISCLLAIPMLAALTPAKHEVRVFDENVDGIDYDWPADLAALSVMTMFAPRAYEICAQYRARGIRTVLGGIHPSVLPEEALEHCDTVVIGEAEQTWPAVLQDADVDRLKRTYRADRPADLACSPAPDRTPLARHRYFSENIQTTKGCPFSCEFCSVHAFDGQRIRHKTVQQVVREIRDVQTSPSRYKKKKAVFFADDNLIADMGFARELIKALEPLQINWMCQASVNVAQDDELLRQMRRSGCGAIFVGFESISSETLGQMNKAVNKRHDYAQVIGAIQSHGMLVQPSFILGYDSDSSETFDQLIDFVRGHHLFAPVFNILTPFPGTRLFQRLEDQGRILHRDWSLYDTRHVVFKPAGMSPDELLAGYRSVVQEVYSFESILERLRHYWHIDFWKEHNKLDAVKLKYRLLFALRLCTLLASHNAERSSFITRMLPRVFNRHVRVSSILAQMAYNDFAYSL